MELKAKGKFETTLSEKVKIFQKSFCPMLEKINENYDKRYIFGYHDALKIYGVPKLY